MYTGWHKGNVGKAEKQGGGGWTKKKHRTKRKKKGGEWEEKMVLFDISNRVI